MTFMTLADAVKPVLARAEDRANGAPACRYVKADATAAMLLEISDGDSEVIGPVVSHAEAEEMAKQLLANAAARGGLPVPLHKLALAYLAARKIEALGPAPRGRR